MKIRDPMSLRHPPIPLPLFFVCSQVLTCRIIKQVWFFFSFIEKHDDFFFSDAVFALSYTHWLALMVICHTLICVYLGTCFFATCNAVHNATMGWLRSVGSIKLQVSFAKEPYKRDDILQKRPIFYRSY